MVWRSFSKKKLNKIVLKTKGSALKKEPKKTFKMLLSERFEKRSGVVHGIELVTGKKVKDAFVDLQLKKTYGKPQNKKFNRRRLRRGGLPLALLDRVSHIKDGDRLASDSVDKSNLFSSKRLKKLKNGKYMPTIYNKKWAAMHSGTLIDKKQATYLQSKEDIKVKSYKIKLRNFKNYVSGVTNNMIWLDMFSDRMVFDARDHDSENFNTFIRYYCYKTLLLRSFWFSKLVSTIVKCGKKIRVWNYVLRGFSFLKAEFGRNPVVLLFEILEMYRMPIRGLAPKSTTRKSVIRTHLVPWWKQYTQILRWVRHSILGKVKNHESWNKRIRTEFFSLVIEDANCLVKKRIEANFQLIAYGRIAIHFRWYKRYSKRTVRSIRILDRKLYLI